MKLLGWVSVALVSISTACAVSGARSSDLPVALRWVAPSVDAVTALTTQPATCLRRDVELQDVEAGELLFNSPLLLGGQASKAGLHCGSCHQNGRGNPGFLFSGISGSPGTADVTHGLFGPRRADDVFNPVSIPDLAHFEGQTRVDRADPGALEAFLRAQITEEFEGPAPSALVIDDLAAYIRALDDASCTADRGEMITWQQEYDRAIAGLQILQDRERADQAALSAYRHAIRAALGRLDRRFSGPENRQIRAQLEHISFMVRDRSTPMDIAATLRALRPQLAEHAELSLYEPSQLASVLERSQP